MEGEMVRVDYKMKRMAAYLKGYLKKAKLVDSELKLGLMENDMKVNGRKGKCMARENSYGKRVKCIRVNM